MKNLIKKQIIFSGVKPSGGVHLGNYLGAIKHWVWLQGQPYTKTIFCVVDEHTITVPQDPKELYNRSLEVAAAYIAFGINPKKSIIFLQSHVSAHTELGWILNTFTPVGALQRMTQYKDALSRGKPPFAGLLNYPTLMAADILLYQTNKVPVGDDQLQHIELTRSIAERFNNKFGNTFTIPEPLIYKDTARIMSLTHPTQKMAKSDDDPDSIITFADSPKEIIRKINRAVTDSDISIRYDEKTKPGIANLIKIYAAINGVANSRVESKFKDKSYAEFKTILAQTLVGHLQPFQDRFQKLQKNPEDILDILKIGAKKANTLAKNTLIMVKRKMGFVL